MEALKKQIKEIYCETINNGKCVYNIKQKILVWQMAKDSHK